MNLAPGQGPAGHPNAQRNDTMYRPEMMRTIRFLTEEERGKYEKGLAVLWKQHDATPQGSPANDEAKKKITEFGRMLVTKIQQRRNLYQQSQAAQGASTAQGQPSQQQPPQQPGQLAGQHIQQGQPAQQQPQMAQQIRPPAPGLVNEGGTGPPPTPTTASVPMPNQPAGPNTLAQQINKFPANIQNHLNEMVFNPPPGVADKEKWVQDVKMKYARALFQMEQARGTIAKIDQGIKDRKEKGPPLSAEEEKGYAERKVMIQKQYSDAYQFVSSVRKGVATPKNAPNGNAPQGAAPQGGNQGRPQVPVRQTPGQPGPGGAPGGAAGPGLPMQSSTAAVNAAIEAAKNQQLAAGRLQGTNLPGPQGQTNHPGQAPATGAQAQPLPVAHATPTQATPAQQNSQQPQAPIKVEPGTQPNIPAPLNTAIAAGVASNLSAGGTPTQNSARVQTPQSATPTNPSIRPLTHAAAINLAGQQRAGGQPGSAPASAPGSTGSQQQGHPHAHPAASQPSAQTAQTQQSKLPIPKVLPDKATQVPTPVAVMGGAGAGRPTYSGGSSIAGGVMNQPAIAKTPAYQLEGEGERVLNKKKLDELVRQVCGGTAEGQEGNLLTPEVEESVLNLADHFVDSVLQTACRNAKERGSKVLEIRDLQLVLERTYNIRIPGYSSEELRTVRKVQPNAQWITKMSAVQAAKVMPGKGDL